MLDNFETVSKFNRKAFQIKYHRNLHEVCFFVNDIWFKLVELIILIYFKKAKTTTTTKTMREESNRPRRRQVNKYSFLFFFKFFTNYFLMIEDEDHDNRTTRQRLNQGRREQSTRRRWNVNKYFHFPFSLPTTHFSFPCSALLLHSLLLFFHFFSFLFCMEWNGMDMIMVMEW